jgi:hypothetical protein
MDPEEYEQTVRALWGGAARLAGVVVLIEAAPIALWVAAQAWFALVRGFDAVGVRPPGPAGGAAALAAFLVRRDWFRWRVALAGAAGTLALGVAAGVFQLDGQWCQRTGRFWYRPPKELDDRLGVWAGCRRGAPAGPAARKKRKRKREPGAGAPVPRRNKP